VQNLSHRAFLALTHEKIKKQKKEDEKPNAKKGGIGHAFKKVLVI